MIDIARVYAYLIKTFETETISTVTLEVARDFSRSIISGFLTHHGILNKLKILTYNFIN